MRKTEEDRGMMLLRYGRAVLLGAAAAFLACLVFLLLASVAISRGLLGAGLQDRLAIAGCVAGAFAGGTLATRLCERRGLLIGLMAGGVLFLFQLTLGVLLYGRISIENGGLGLLLGALCGGASAGLFSGGGRKATVKKRKRGKA